MLALAVALSTGCASDQEKYCDAVKDHQQELGEILGTGSPDALLKALPIFRDLADKAPEDLRDEWKTLIDAVAGLQKALEDAGVDPATYDRDHPPEGLEPGRPGCHRRGGRPADQRGDRQRRSTASTSRPGTSAGHPCRSADRCAMGNVLGRLPAPVANCRADTYVTMLSLTLPPNS